MELSNQDFFNNPTLAFIQMMRKFLDNYTPGLIKTKISMIYIYCIWFSSKLICVSDGPWGILHCDSGLKYSFYLLMVRWKQPNLLLAAMHSMQGVVKVLSIVDYFRVFFKCSKGKSWGLCNT